MPIVRKIYSIVFGALLTICLVVLPFSFLIKSDLGSPNKLKTWFKQADLYSVVINNLSLQLEKAVTSINFQIKPDISNSEINIALKSSVSESYFYQNVDNVVDANYSWLKGQTNKPDFLIDLAVVKNGLVNNLVNSQTSLAVCNQLVAYRLSTLSECQANLTTALNSNSVFSNYQTVNQDNLVSYLSGSSNSTPYYEQYSYLPSRFQTLMKTPVYTLVAIIAVILLSAIILGLGFRLIKFIFKSVIAATIILIVLRLLINPIFNSVQKISVIANNSNSDLIIKMINYFLIDFKRGLNNFLIGYVIIFALLVIVIFIIKSLHKNRKNKTPKNPDTKPVSPSQNFLKLNERSSQNK